MFLFEYLDDENYFLILSQEYFINGNNKCSCQQTAGYSKQTVPEKIYS